MRKGCIFLQRTTPRRRVSAKKISDVPRHIAYFWDRSHQQITQIFSLTLEALPTLSRR